MAVTRTYDMPKVMRESLADVIYDISPTKTPFMSNAGRSTADSTYEEWLTDDLASADANNAAIEGADAVDSTITDQARVGNYTQISTKTVNVSGTSGAVTTAGMKTKEAFELAKKSKELKRDMETILLSNQAAAAGSGVAARKLAGLPAWIKTNTVIKGAAVAPTLSSTTSGYPNAAWTSLTGKVAFAEADLKTAIQKVWTAGGEVGICMVGPVNKARASGFTGLAEQRINIDNAKQSMIVGAADVYVSDFGNVTFVPNIFQDETFAMLIDPDYVSVAFLRDFKRIPLAKTGDSTRTQLLVEYTLKVNNEKAHGVVANITTT